MKRLSTFVLLGAMTAASSAAATGSFSLNEFTPHVMPVLVQVNAHGKVTSVSPSTQLNPRFQRLLRDNIQELITGPATEKNKAISSQFVLNLALRTTPRADGTYDAHFAYVSAVPMPFGPMHWVKIDGHRLALARDGDTFNSRGRADYARRERQINSNYQNQRAMQMPSTRSAGSPSSNSARTSNGH